MAIVIRHCEDGCEPLESVEPGECFIYRDELYMRAKGFIDRAGEGYTGSVMSDNIDDLKMGHYICIRLSDGKIQRMLPTFRYIRKVEWTKITYGECPIPERKGDKEDDEESSHS